jgi:TfoX/Sxy family transcriptional regulator of competence genes
MNPNSEEILKRIRIALHLWKNNIEETRMFGGTCFLFKGKMCVGETKERLMVRIPAERMQEITKSPFVKPMDFTGKPMKEFILVTTKGFDTEEKLQQWTEIGVAHAKTKLK